VIAPQPPSEFGASAADGGGTGVEAVQDLLSELEANTIPEGEVPIEFTLVICNIIKERAKKDITGQIQEFLKTTSWTGSKFKLNNDYQHVQTIARDFITARNSKTGRRLCKSTGDAKLPDNGVYEFQIRDEDEKVHMVKIGNHISCPGCPQMFNYKDREAKACSGIRFVCQGVTRIRDPDADKMKNFHGLFPNYECTICRENIAAENRARIQWRADRKAKGEDDAPERELFIRSGRFSVCRWCFKVDHWLCTQRLIGGQTETSCPSCRGLDAYAHVRTRPDMPFH
jgi:hypothetical protein